MKESIVKFMSLYKSIAKVGIDSSYLKIKSKKHGVNKKQFLKRIYLNREGIQKMIYRDILLNNDDLICIVGPRGCGKSSIGFKIKDDLEKDKSQKTFIIPINIRKEEAKKHFDTNADAKAYIRKRIINYYKKQFPPKFQLKAKNPFIKLYSFLLDTTIGEEYRPTDIFIHFEDLAQDAEVEMAGTGHESITEWLTNCFHEKEVKKLIKKVKKELDVIYLSYALAYIYDYEQQVIWIDNIDALNEYQQQNLINGINKIQTSSLETLTYVIAVREENIFREEHLSDFGTRPFRSAIYWKDPFFNKPEIANNAFNMEVVSKDEFNQIIVKRIEFVKLYQIYSVKKLTKEKENVKADKSLSDKERQSKLEGIQKELDQFLPVINETDYKKIKTLSLLINDVFYREKIHYISNNSLRNMIPLHREFLYFEIKRDFGGSSRITDSQSFEPSSLRLPKPFLQTELLQFITSHNKDLMFKLLDIVSYTENKVKKSDKELYCFLPNLVITTIWNLCIENTLEREEFYIAPTIEDVINKLKAIGFEDAEVIETIFNLYRQKNGKSNFLAISSEKKIKQVSDLELKMKVRPTYRGKTAVSSIISSFGYIYPLCSKSDKNAMIYTSPNRTNQDGYKILPIISSLGEAHLKSLLYIKKNHNNGNNKVNWLEHYYMTYGIPMMRPYCRSYQGKVSFPNRKYSLVFESILYSLIAYFEHRKAHSLISKFKKLEQEYLQFRNLIEKEVTDNLAIEDIQLSYGNQKKD